MDGYDASTYGDGFADVYDDWYATVTDVAACADRLAKLVVEVGGGAVLELGVGSGRLALPLASRGLEVHGIDASVAMLDRLRAKPGAEAIQVTHGDMAVLDLGEAPVFAVVFVAFNTFFNLGTVGEQERCFANVADRLAPGGVFVVEAFVPPEHGPAKEDAVTPRRLAVDEVVLSVSHHDRTDQTISGQHVHLTEAGTRLRPWHLRYSTPDQLDSMAAAAGLSLAWRDAGWSHETFGPDASVHVCAYGRANVRSVHTGAADLR